MEVPVYFGLICANGEVVAYNGVVRKPLASYGRGSVWWRFGYLLVIEEVWPEALLVENLVHRSHRLRLVRLVVVVVVVVVVIRMRTLALTATLVQIVCGETPVFRQSIHQMSFGVTLRSCWHGFLFHGPLLSQR